MVDYIIAEFGTNVQNIMREAKLYRDITRVVDGIQRTTAGLFLGTAATGIIPGFHGHTNDLITLFVEKNSCKRAVDAAAHGDKNASVFTHCSNLPKVECLPIDDLN